MEKGNFYESYRKHDNLKKKIKNIQIWGNG